MLAALIFIFEKKLNIKNLRLMMYKVAKLIIDLSISRVTGKVKS